MREAGCRIAVDDLGEGCAGLSWLAHLRPGIAKIDMPLVRDAHRSPLKSPLAARLVGRLQLIYAGSEYLCELAYYKINYI